MSITQQEIRELKDIICKLYLEDEIPWVIGYSGGKDSTATLQLVWYALLELPDEQRKHKPVHVISTDTLVESPVVAKSVEHSLEAMQQKATEDNMPILTHRLTPEINDTYWVNLLGRGYPYPRTTMRWCTDRLKIKPANTFIRDVVSTFGEAILVLGTRKAESINRARNMEYYQGKRIRDHLSPNGSMQNELVFSPIEDWSNDDVWLYLMQYVNPWNYSNKTLLAMYRGATTDNECPLVINEDTPSCGKSRFGCWMCTLVEQDKSMAAMIINDQEKEWMTSLLNFRNYIGNSELDRTRRDFRRMNGRAHMYHGRLVHGPYQKEIREEWLKMLLEIQRDININGPEEFRDLKLISIEELKCIRQIWLNEKHEFDDALPTIYKNVIGKEFPDQNYHVGSGYNQPEWRLLSQVCHDLFPDEELIVEMVSSIVDLEKKSVGLGKRYGIRKSIESQIRRCFYMDEDDALAFAANRIAQKKKMGADYDPKASNDNAQLDLLNDEEN